MTRLIAAALVTASVAVYAQQPARPPADIRTRPESVGMSTARLSRIKTAMQRHVDRGDIAGAVTLVARRGHIVHFEAVGYRDIASASQLTTDAIFRIRSMTKPIVSVAAMILYEEGHFQLSDPVTKWLPDFSNMRVVDVPYQDQRPGMPYSTTAAARPITMQHILTHTAGLPADGRGATQPEYVKIRPRSLPEDTLEAFVKRLARLPLNFQPGAAFEYGPATDVVGRVIEVICKCTLEQFLTERVLRPLKMDDTHFFLPASKRPRLASLYQMNANGLTLSAEDPSSPMWHPTYYSATSGLLSTASDYSRFHQMMLNDGELDGVRILGRKTVELMTTSHTGDLFRMAPGLRFGLGYAIVDDVGIFGVSGSRGMYTWPGSHTTSSFVDPMEQMVGVMMIQLEPRSASITNEFQILAYQAMVGPRQTSTH